MSLRLNRVPPLGEVADVAREARRAWGLHQASRLDLDRICDRLGIEVSVLSMGAPGGGMQGLLIPRRGGGFRIEVDPEPTNGWESVAPPLYETLKRHRKRFLIAHELAHTLFFEDRYADRPRRVVFDSPQQEIFCDELARALLVPRCAAASLPFDPEGVVALQHRFDVSMEVALRSAVATHEDAEAAWLLLRHDEKMLVQWSSMDRRFTARALHALRRLAAVASRDRHAEATLNTGKMHAQALYLSHREQVVVTCTRRFSRLSDPARRRSASLPA